MLTLRAGEVIDRYEVVRRLGAGGMATVYEVRHRVLDTRHALKVLKNADDGQAARLVREGRVQARLDHPNLLPVTDVLELHGAPALIMPLVDGPSLDDVLKRKPLSVDEAAALFVGVVAGVAHAHHHGVVHRDLKPGNVMLDISSGRVVPRVADFGLAKPLDAETVARTAAGAFMGTPAYAAPEQFHDASTVDHRADMWALGCILHALLCGRPPFSATTLPGLLLAVATASYPPLAESMPDIDPAWDAILRDLLQPDPDLRVLTAAQLLERIPTSVDGMFASSLEWDSLTPSTAMFAATEATPDEGVGHLDETLDAPERSVADVVHAREPSRSELPEAVRSPRSMILIGGGIVSAGVVAVLVAAAWLMFSGGGEDAPSLGLFRRIEFTAAGWRGVGEPVAEFSGNDGGYELKQREDGAIVITYLTTQGHPMPWPQLLHRRAHRPGPERTLAVLQDCSVGDDCATRELTRWEWKAKIVQWIDDDGKVDRVDRYTLTGQMGHAEFVHTDDGYTVRNIKNPGIRVFELFDPSPGEVHTTDADGRSTYVQYYDRPMDRAGSETSSARRFQYDDLGNLIAEFRLDANGDPEQSQVVLSRYEYADPSWPRRLTRKRHFGVGDVPALDEDFCATVDISYNEVGDLVSTSCFDVGGEARRIRQLGCHRVDWVWTDQTLEYRCLDGTGQPQVAEQGWVTTVLEHDERGYLVVREGRGRDGEPVTDRLGIARTELSYDEFGSLSQVGPHQDASGKAVAPAGLLSTWRRKRNDKGREVERVALGADMLPVDFGRGWAVRQVRYDEAEWPSDLLYFDAEGRPVGHVEGAHRVEWRYDEDGHRNVWRYWGTTGEPVVRIKGGYHEVRLKYSDEGEVIEESYWGVQGEPVIYIEVGQEPKTGVSRRHHMRRSTRKSGGRVVREDFLDRAGEPVLIDRGVASTERVYDDLNRWVEERHYGVDGQPTDDFRGMSHQTRKLGPPGIGELRARRSENVLGQLVAWQSPCGNVTVELPSHNVRMYRCIGLAGEPVIGVAGLHAMRETTNDAAQLIKKEAFGLDGERVNTSIGYAYYEREVDPHGRQLGRRFFDADELPVGAYGTQTVRTAETYDAKGNLSSSACYDVEDELTRCKTGWARTTLEYDDRGRKTLETFEGPDGHPLAGEAAGRTYRYQQAVSRDDTPQSRPIFVQSVDEEGRPFEVRGVATNAMRYHRLGHKIWHATYDSAGELKDNAAGVAITTREVDELGNITGERYTAAAGGPPRIGPATMRYDYDELGRRTATRWFDKDGEPTLGPGGCKVEAMEYSANSGVSKRLCD